MACRLSILHKHKHTEQMKLNPYIILCVMENIWQSIVNCERVAKTGFVCINPFEISTYLEYCRVVVKLRHIWDALASRAFGYLRSYSLHSKLLAFQYLPVGLNFSSWFIVCKDFGGSWALCIGTVCFNF